MILPSLTLGLVLYGEYTLIVRSAMLETLGEDYVLTARAKGLEPWTIVRKHALRNAMLPITTLVALSLGYIVGGAILVETVFSWPGIGRAVYDAVLPARLPDAAGRVPAPDAVRGLLQPRRRPPLLQARPADDRMSVVDPRAGAGIDAEPMPLAPRRSSGRGPARGRPRSSAARALAADHRRRAARAGDRALRPARAGRPGLRAPVGESPARARRRRRSTWSRLLMWARAHLADRRLRGDVRLDGHRRRRSASLAGYFGGRTDTRPDADHRLLPRRSRTSR